MFLYASASGGLRLPPIRRAAFLFALFAILLPLAGCSELTGDDGPAEIVEIVLANADEKLFITVRRAPPPAGSPSGRARNCPCR